MRFPALLVQSVLTVWCACLLLGPAGGSAAAQEGDDAPRVELAADGEASLPVVVAEDAPEAVRQAAEQLADYLGRLSGAEFEVTTGDGSTGIVVGREEDFEALGFDPEFEGGPFGREEYVLRSGDGVLWAIGATELAARHAVWDLLYRLGYRQYFPGETWEIVPEQDTLAIAIDAFERPDYHARRIWYNWGLWGYNNEPYQQWTERNRVVQGFNLNSGHAYGAIHAANQEAFEANPEFYASIDGERVYRGGDTKFCIGNPGLRELVVNHAVQQVEANPELHSISMDPSDGGNWCDETCELCPELGGGIVSDWALTLANEVAEAINELDHGEKYVGMYAYNQHSPPPTIEAHPNVIISVATAFLRGGYTLDQIIEGWREQGATLGIYDYYTVIAWDWNLPRRAKAARPHGVAESLVNFHGEGARFYDSESGDAWGPYGLGFYVGGRAMWDIDEAERVDEIIDEFVTTAFGPASEPMAEFYHLINVDNERRSPGDLLGRMYRHLAEARELAADDADVRERIDHLILYTRYAELYQAFADATGDTEPARDAMVSHAYRMRETMMVHSYGIWARTVGQGAAHTDDHPLKNDDPFTDEEIETFLTEGIANHEPVDLEFTAVEYSEELVPAAERLGLEEVDQVGTYPDVPQERQNYYIWVDEAPAEVNMKVTVQRVWANRDHLIRLFSPKQVYIEAVDESDIVRPDGETYDVVLETEYDGLHRIEVLDGADYTRIEWPEDMRVTLPTSEDTPGVTNHFRGGWSLYFYVPKGTEVVGGWAARIANWAPRLSGTVLDGDGNVLHDFGEGEDGYFSIPVPEGQDGRLWKFDNSQGVRLLLTVPPYVAPSAHDLLLPAEVVEADAE